MSIYTTSSDITPDWVDHVAIARAMAHKKVGRSLHHAERVEIARRLVAAGQGAGELAKVAKCSADTARELIEQVTPRGAAC